MGDAYPVEVDTLDILKAKITKAVKDNGITSDVAEVVIIEPPELKGEHFATETVYAKIHFKDPSVKEKNLFVKKFSSNPLHTEMVKEMKFMEKEAGFFQKFLPFIRNFCKRFPGWLKSIYFSMRSLYCLCNICDAFLSDVKSCSISSQYASTPMTTAS